jgi:hypothetical protein
MAGKKMFGEGFVVEQLNPHQKRFEKGEDPE